MNNGTHILDDNRLYIQYSEDPGWDYKGGTNLPNGTESVWSWEESYIPVPHIYNDVTVGAHKFQRVKVGEKGVWSFPQKIAGNSLSDVEFSYAGEDNASVYYKVTSTYEDGSVRVSSTNIQVPKGEPGKDADGASNEAPTVWFPDEATIRAYTDYEDGIYYGIFSTQSVYLYSSTATVGIQPDDNSSGIGRYVFQYSYAGQFASESDMDTTPMVQAAKATTPYLLQYWWNARNVEEGAEKNVQSDWNAPTGDAHILNKPDDLTDLSLHSVTELNNVTDAGSGAIITTSERDKLAGIEDGAQANVQSDWNAVGGDAFILNKPVIPALNWETVTESVFSDGSQLRIKPVDPAVKTLFIENNTYGLTLLRLKNTNDADIWAGSVIELKGSGADFQNSMFIGKYGAGYSLPLLQDSGAMLCDKNLALGTVGATNQINFVVGGGSYNTPTQVGEWSGSGFKVDSLGNAKVIETNASGYLIGATKGTAYNKDFGTVAGTVLEGDTVIPNQLWVEQGNDIYFIAGDVGVGINLPTEKLHVEGNTLLSNGIVTIQAAEPNVQLVGSSFKHTIQQNGAGQLRFINDTSTVNLVLNQDGKLGVGTENPSAKLTVANGAILLLDESDNTQVEFNYSSQGGLSRYYQDNLVKLFVGTEVAAYGTGTGALNFVYGDHPFHISTNSFRRLTVLGNGNVGIGTTAPAGKLNINTGLSGIPISFPDMANGSISFTNVSSTKALPSILGKSNDNGGLYLGAGTNDINNIDMYFNVRENDGTDFTTLTSTAFAFQRFGTDLMTILRNGNVGIGTTAPSRTLDIAGDVLITSPDNNLRALDVITSDNDIETVRIRNGGGSGTGLVVESGVSNNNFSIADFRNYNGVSRLYIQGDGNVGIGTTAPDQLFDVNGSAIIGDTAVNSNSTKLYLKNASGKTWAISSGTNNVSETSFGIYNWSDSASSPYFTIESGGNVGIGTNSPNAKLDIPSRVGFETILVGRSSGKASIKARSDDGNLILDSSGGVLFLNNYVSDNIVICNGGGNVGIGIGITSPSEALEISGNIKTQTGDRIINTPTTGTTTGTSGPIILELSGTYKEYTLAATGAGTIAPSGGTVGDTRYLSITGNYAINFDDAVSDTVYGTYNGAVGAFVKIYVSTSGRYKVWIYDEPTP